MTKRQRAQVVELLRCAADANNVMDTFALALTRYRLRSSLGVGDMACRAIVENFPRGGDDWRRDLLEAAARVEEGSWP